MRISIQNRMNWAPRDLQWLWEENLNLFEVVITKCQAVVADIDVVATARAAAQQAAAQQAAAENNDDDEEVEEDNYLSEGGIRRPVDHKSAMFIARSAKRSV